MLLMREDMTPEEYLEYVALHPETHFDFIDGELVEVTPKRIHGSIQAFLARIFGNYLEGKALGIVHTEVLHVLQGKKFQPDVSINRPTDADYFTEPPLVAVEIRSDSQSRVSQRRKARDYTRRGTPLVLLVLPHEGVEVFRPGHQREVLTVDDHLTGYDVLPGFQLAVRDLFLR